MCKCKEQQQGQENVKCEVKCRMTSEVTERIRKIIKTHWSQNSPVKQKFANIGSLFCDQNRNRLRVTTYHVRFKLKITTHQVKEKF